MNRVALAKECRRNHLRASAPLFRRSIGKMIGVSPCQKDNRWEESRERYAKNRTKLETKDSSLVIPERKRIADDDEVFEERSLNINEIFPKLDDYLLSTDSISSGSSCSVSVLSSVLHAREIDDCLKSTASSVSASLSRGTVRGQTRSGKTFSTNDLWASLASMEDQDDPNASKGTMTTASCSSLEEQEESQTEELSASSSVDSDNKDKIIHTHSHAQPGVSSPHAAAAAAAAAAVFAPTFALIGTSSKDDNSTAPASKLDELRTKMKDLRVDCQKKIAESRATLNQSPTENGGETESNCKNGSSDCRRRSWDRFDAQRREWADRAVQSRCNLRAATRNNSSITDTEDVDGGTQDDSFRRQSRWQAQDRTEKVSSLNAKEAIYHASASVLRVPGTNTNDCNSPKKRKGRRTRPFRSAAIEQLVMKFENPDSHENNNDTASYNNNEHSSSTRSSLPVWNEMGGNLKDSSYLQFLCSEEAAKQIPTQENSNINSRSTIEFWKSIYSKEEDCEEAEPEPKPSEEGAKRDRKRKQRSRSPKDIFQRLSRYKNFRATSLPFSPQKRTVRRFLKRSEEQPHQYAEFKMPDEIGL